MQMHVHEQAHAPLRSHGYELQQAESHLLQHTMLALAADQQGALHECKVGF
jgi:hypothetical protein